MSTQNFYLIDKQNPATSSATDLSTDVVLVTPEMAAGFLQNAHPKNRSLNESTIISYATQMEQGNWALNGEPLIFDEDGKMSNGHHRCSACVLSGASFLTLIVRGVSDKAFDTIDTGKTRSASDVLTMEGFQPALARDLSSACCLIMPFEKYGRFTGRHVQSGLLTNHNIKEWVSNHPRIVELAEKLKTYSRLNRPLAAGHLLFVWYFVDQIDSDSAAVFFDGLLTGANLQKYDPRLIFRQRMEYIKFPTNRISYTPRQRIGLLLRTWGWWANGKEVNYPANFLRNDQHTIDRAFSQIMPASIEQ